MATVNANSVTKVVELQSVDISLSGDEAYYLIGLLGATTDGGGKDLYNALCNAVEKSTGERGDTIFINNRVAKDAYHSIRNGRFSGTPNSTAPESKTITLVYDGYERVVKDPTFEGTLLKGYELNRGGKVSEQFKSYRLDKIGKKYPLNFLTSR
jgi:hypothetical protein